MNDPLAPRLRENILRMAEAGKRLDGRRLDEARKLEIKTGTIEKAEGSADVLLGDTRVVVGVKIEKGVPYPDTPDEGMLSVNAELVPLASPNFESGPPSDQSIELARVIDRGVRESKCIDMKTMVLAPGKMVRSVFIDLWVLDDNGNLLDAAGAGAVAALKTTTMPELKYDEKTGKVEKLDSRIALPMSDLPVPCTTAKIGKFLFLDPTNEEEEAMDSRITIATDEKGNIRAMQKGGEGTFAQEEIEQAIEWSVARGREVRKLLK